MAGRQQEPGEIRYNNAMSWLISHKFLDLSVEKRSAMVSRQMTRITVSMDALDHNDEKTSKAVALRIKQWDYDVINDTTKQQELIVQLGTAIVTEKERGTLEPPTKKQKTENNHDLVHDLFCIKEKLTSDPLHIQKVKKYMAMTNEKWDDLTARNTRYSAAKIEVHDRFVRYRNTLQLLLNLVQAQDNNLTGDNPQLLALQAQIKEQHVNSKLQCVQRWRHALDSLEFALDDYCYVYPRLEFIVDTYTARFGPDHEQWPQEWPPLDG
ncbi:MAG: hypothetical protein SGARI_002805 [Bacillariaceae sp.]